MARRTRVTTWYARRFHRFVKFGSERSLAVARTVNAITSADHLPGPSDFEASEIPVGRARVRRVGGRNLWRWYHFNDSEVMLFTVTTEPPIPLDDDPDSASPGCSGTIETDRTESPPLRPSAVWLSDSAAPCFRGSAGASQLPQTTRP